MCAQVLVTEIQPAPAGGEPEWIEIENTGSTTVDIDGWMVCDNRSCGRIIDAKGLKLIAGRRAVITKDVEAFAEVRTVPSDVLLIECSLPSLNNSSDVVVLRDADSVVIDQMMYSMRQYVKGRSVERVGRAYSSRVEYDTTWQACLTADSATPGTLNSNVHLKNDLRLAELRIADAAFAIVVVNHGLQTSRATSVNLRFTAGGHQYRTSTEVRALLPTEHVEWTVSLAQCGWPEHQGIASITATIEADDDRAENNTLRAELILPPSPGTVTITELMVDPWSPVRDYVELWNGTDSTVDVTSWSITDGSGRRSVASTLSAIPPHAYGVMSSTEDVRTLMDSGSVVLCKPTMDLNATTDVVVVRNSSGFLIDSLQYSATWHSPELPSTKGIGLEKLDVQLPSTHPTSWTSSAALRGGTPGSANSVHIHVQETGTMQAMPNPFSTQRTSTRHPTIITYEQPFQHAITSLTVHRTDGLQVRTLLNATLSGSKGAVAWDGTNDDGVVVANGQYVAVLRSVDLSSTRTYRNRCVLVVGE